MHYLTEDPDIFFHYSLKSLAEILFGTDIKLNLIGYMH
jgi:hypothetical protein